MGYVVAALWECEAGHEDVVRDAVEKLTPPSRAEPGNQYYQAYQDPEAPTVFRLFEVYDDEAAYAAHGASEHFATYGLGQAVPLLVRRERAFYQTLG